ncbi:MAG TPA: gephyrin-like molybdotransferase Glp [Blastocatellia bacterium]|nr:gephyrin-like molybdotransferase Glp [Blastocatellia bacterium]
MLRIEDALDIILEHTPAAENTKEEVPLSDALGRVLRQDVVSDLDMPPFDRARMDGYAVRSVDISGARPDKPAVVEEIGEAVAGRAFSGFVGVNEAVRIMTGAPVPPGADSVQKIEVISVNDHIVEIYEPTKPQQNITPRGIEAKAGTLMLEAGAIITPAAAAVLASFGYAMVEVARRPKLVLLSTGDELVEVWEKPQAAQIRNSNTFSLAGYAQAAGAEVLSAGIVRDDFTETKLAIAEAAAMADVVMLSGGVSMGDYDLVKPALTELGAEIFVEKVAMHPGKPTVFAKLGDTLIFGLPGNPVSVAVAFHIFARPALLKMQGANEIYLPRVLAKAAANVKGAPPRRSHQPGRLVIRNGVAEVEPLKWAGSSDVIAFMQADALIVVPEDRKGYEAGELVEVIQLR